MTKHKKKRKKKRKQKQPQAAPPPPPRLILIESGCLPAAKLVDEPPIPKWLSGEAARYALSANKVDMAKLRKLVFGPK